MESVRLRSRLSALGLAVALALLAASCTNKALGIETEGRDINPAVGSNVAQYPAGKRSLKPVFSGPLLAGGTYSAGDNVGAVTVVNFWASWCTPCIAEQPVLERTAQKYRDRGVKFVGINIRDTLPNAKAFFENFDFDVTYPSIFDRDQRLAYVFRVSSPPSTFVLDRDGRVAARLTGAATEAGELDVLIDKVIAE